MKNYKSKKGFSLMEVVMSIGVLAFTSGFIIQMFLVATNLNQKAKDLDAGSNIAMKYIELFKSSTTASEYLMLNFPDLDKESLDNKNNSYIVHKYYNENWEELEKNNPNIKFDMSVILKNDGQKNDSIKYFATDKEIIKVKDGYIYFIEAMINEKINDDNKFLVKFGTSKYFIHW